MEFQPTHKSVLLSGALPTEPPIARQLMMNWMSQIQGKLAVYYN